MFKLLLIVLVILALVGGAVEFVSDDTQWVFILIKKLCYQVFKMEQWPHSSTLSH